ncbi:MAG: hypothetical protein ACYC9S_09000 [Leptospirales bacterium]
MIFPIFELDPGVLSNQTHENSISPQVPDVSTSQYLTNVISHSSLPSSWEAYYGTQGWFDGSPYDYYVHGPRAALAFCETTGTALLSNGSSLFLFRFSNFSMRNLSWSYSTDRHWIAAVFGGDGRMYAEYWNSSSKNTVVWQISSSGAELSRWGTPGYSYNGQPVLASEQAGQPLASDGSTTYVGSLFAPFMIFNASGSVIHFNSINGLSYEANNLIQWEGFSVGAGGGYGYYALRTHDTSTNVLWNGIAVFNQTAQTGSFSVTGHISAMTWDPYQHEMVGVRKNGGLVSFNQTQVLNTIPSQGGAVDVNASGGMIWIATGTGAVQAINLSTDTYLNFSLPYSVAALSPAPYGEYFVSAHHFGNLFIPPPWPATFQQSGLPGFDSWTIHLTNSSSTITKALHSSSLYGLWLGGIYSANATTPDPRYGALDEQIDVSAVSAYDMSFRMLSVTESASALGQSSMIPAAPTTGVYLLIAYNTSSGRIYQYLPASQLSQYNSGYEDATWDVSIPSNATYIEVQGQPSWISPYASLPYQAGSSSISILQDPSSFMISWLVPHSSSGSGGSPGSNGSAPANAATGIWALLGFTVNPPASSLSGDAIYLLSAESGRGMYLIVALLAILYYLVALRKKLQEKHPAGGRR